MDFFKVKDKVGVAAALEICCANDPDRLTPAVVDKLSLMDISAVFCRLSPIVQDKLLKILAKSGPDKDARQRQLAFVNLIAVLKSGWNLPLAWGGFIFHQALKVLPRLDNRSRGPVVETVVGKNYPALSYALFYAAALSRGQESNEVLMELAREPVEVMARFLDYLRFYHWQSVKDSWLWPRLAEFGRRVTSEEMGRVLCLRGLSEDTRRDAKKMALEFAIR